MPNVLYMLNKWLNNPNNSFKKAFINFRARFSAIKETAGYKGSACPVWARAKRNDLILWVQDVLRHTGLTYHFKMTGKKGETCAWGRTGLTMLGRCYLGRAFDIQAVQFWLMLPTNTSFAERVSVYHATLIKLSYSRLINGLRLYLNKMGITKTLFSDDPRNWKVRKIAISLAKAVEAEEKRRPQKVFPKPPVSASKCPQRKVLAELCANRSYSKVAKLLKVSNATISRWCIKLQIQRTFIAPCAPPKRVSDSDFKKMCQTMNTKEIMKATGYSKTTVSRRSNELGLRPKARRPTTN